MLRLDNCAIVLVDVQGRLARMIDNHQAMIKRQQLLLKAARILQVPVIWAEQLPEKLGATVEELRESLEGLEPISKSSFGCLGEERLDRAIERCGRRQIVVAGIEAHVCVYQTVQQLLEQHYQVAVTVDAIGSRHPLDYQTAVARMQAEGAIAVTVEMLLFEWMSDARHPDFRDISRLLKNAG